MTQRELTHPENHPCHYEGDGINGLEIYFEDENSLQDYLQWERDEDHKITLQGNDIDDYVAEG